MLYVSSEQVARGNVKTRCSAPPYFGKSFASGVSDPERSILDCGDQTDKPIVQVTSLQVQVNNASLSEAKALAYGLFNAP